MSYFPDHDRCALCGQSDLIRLQSYSCLECQGRHLLCWPCIRRVQKFIPGEWEFVGKAVIECCPTRELLMALVLEGRI